MKTNKVEALHYNLKRSARKTLSIYIERDGSVSVLTPKELDQKKVDKLVQAMSYQIFKFLAPQEELKRPHRTREVVNGENYLYLGRNYQFRKNLSNSIKATF